MRRAVILVLAGALALPAGVAVAGPPHKPPFKLDPKTIHAGNVLKVSGKPGGGCGQGDRVTLYSNAFPPGREFAGVNAVYVKVRSSGKFTKHVRIPSSVPTGDYSVGARCNGGNLGSRTLHVLNP
jgi:hypothetical protein